MHTYLLYCCFLLNTILLLLSKYLFSYIFQIETARTRAIKLVESTLQLRNIDLIATYAFKGEKSGPLPVTSTVQNEIINPALNDAQVISFHLACFCKLQFFFTVQFIYC